MSIAVKILAVVILLVLVAKLRSLKWVVIRSLPTDGLNRGEVSGGHWLVSPTKLFLLISLLLAVVIGLFRMDSSLTRFAFQVGGLFAIGALLAFALPKFQKTVHQSGNATPGRCRSLDVALEKEAAFEKVLTGVKSLPRVSVKRRDPEAGTILAVTGTTWRSWGEHIIVELKPVSQGVIRVQVRSVPKLRTTIGDWGKGHENVNTILRSLQS